MGSLANQYISQSYTSLIHLGSDTTASANFAELQDGLGNGIGIYVNTLGDVSIDGKLVVSGTFDIEGKITVNDDVRVNGNLSVSGATSLTGSLDVTQNITASNALIENDLIVSGTLYASKVVTLIESSSIIYSSGSNILGDATSDTQTLIGTVIMSGSASLTGSMGVSNNISSSTISGIGNVTLYSQSVDARLVYLEVPFSTSVDARIDALEDFSSSTFNAFSTSVDNRLDVVEATASLYVPFSTSVDSRLDVVEATSSLYVPFSTSVDSRLDVVEATASLYVPFSTSVDSRLDEVEATASYLNTTFSTSVDSRLDSTATTGSNTFIGNEIFSGSVRGNVIPITITSNTASMDCSLGNFFTLQLAGSTTRLVPTNILPGETISLRVTQGSTPAALVYGNEIGTPSGSFYSPTSISGAIDIVTFISFDSTKLNAVAVKNIQYF
jgi:cytoskeletal protein CcmA (bactofilin family)